MTTHRESPLSAPPPSRSGNVAVPLPAADAFPLFGPLGERQWAPGWEPQFLRPLPAADVEGCVFTTRDEHGREVLWLNTRFDAVARVAAYVYLVVGQRVTEIEVAVSEDGPQRSRAAVTYRWTPLSPEGAAEIAPLAARFDDWMREWEAAIAGALAAR